MSTQNLLVPRSFVEAVAERADKDLRYDAQDILAKAPIPVCVTAEMVRELRERTGEGLMSCNKALHAHNGDIEGAIEHLRCEGQLVVRRPGSLQPCGCPVK